MFPVSVSFLLQCDSESDIDDKVRLLFLCLFARHMKWLRVVNNKFELSTKGGRQSQCVVSEKRRGVIDTPPVPPLLIICILQSKKVTRKTCYRRGFFFFLFCFSMLVFSFWV